MVDRDAELLAALQDLSARFPIVPRATVRRLLMRCFDEFADAPVRRYVPLLARREAERRLRDLDALPAGSARGEPARPVSDRVPAGRTAPRSAPVRQR